MSTPKSLPMTNGQQQPGTPPRGLSNTAGEDRPPPLPVAICLLLHCPKNSLVSPPLRRWICHRIQWPPNVGTLSFMLLRRLSGPHLCRGLGQSSTGLQNLSTFFFVPDSRPPNLPTPGALSSYGIRMPVLLASLKRCSFAGPVRRMAGETHSSSAHRRLPTALRSVSVRTPMVSPLRM